MKTLLIVASIIFSFAKLGCIAFDSIVSEGKQQSIISSEKREVDNY